MNPTLQQEAAAETYEDCKALIYNTALRFRAKYGGNLEDLLSETNVAFLHALESYNDDSDVSFSGWLHYCLWFKMLDMTRKQCYRNARARKLVLTEGNDLDCEIHPTSTLKFNMTDFLDELSDDAAAVVRLILDTPGYVWRDEDPSPSGSPKLLIESYLYQLGWELSRIASSFQEISSALNPA